jgi:predicted transcriptional regulator
VYNIKASLKRKEMDMDNIRRLPDAEFDVMVALWNCKVTPVNTAYLMETVGIRKGWKAPTLISFLTRLEEKGFVYSEKKGKERHYYPIADKSLYIKNVAIDFIDRYFSGSVVEMVDMVCGELTESSDQIDEMKKWIQKQF